MAIAQALHGDRSWKGMGLVSGSKLSDIIDTLREFVRIYDRANWPNILRTEIPELPEADVEWLSSLSQTMEHLEPPTGMAPTAPGSATITNGRRRPPKRPRTALTRRSPRFSGPAAASPTMAPTQLPSRPDLDPVHNPPGPGLPRQQ
jgi:hypothetical protein